MRLVVALAGVVACSGSSSDDIVGPFSGTTHRYVVDRIDVPRDGDQAKAVADDLDGDGMVENKFGYATAVLATTNDLSPDAADMIASGVLASVVEIQANDLTTDGSVGVRYFGAEGDAATVIGGRFVAGTFTSNRTREAERMHLGAAQVRLPVFVNADPVLVPIEAAELVLVPDGAGGFDGILRGGIPEAEARAAAHVGLVEMFETEPDRHLVFLRGVDEDRDDAISYPELEDSVIGILVATDVEPDLVSIAFAFHLRACPDGNCALGTVQNDCRDRVRGGDETDVDCGGSCQRCWAGKQCGAPADCQSNACDAGKCRAPACSDGVQDGYESDIDCGGVCPTCATGKSCAADRDCASGNCNMGVGTVGSCI